MGIVLQLTGFFPGVTIYTALHNPSHFVLMISTAQNCYCRTLLNNSKGIFLGLDQGK